jgi:hypothetical protein
MHWCHMMLLVQHVLKHAPHSDMCDMCDMCVLSGILGIFSLDLRGTTSCLSHVYMFP